MEIPWKSLEEGVLLRLIEEVVTRDGTDYGAEEKSRDQKIAEAKKALESGKAAILWDMATETVSLIVKI